VKAPVTTPSPAGGVAGGCEATGAANSTSARLAWSMWSLAVVLIVLSFLLDYLTTYEPRSTPKAVVAFFRVLALAYPTVGAVIASRRPGNPIGWIFCCAGLLNAFQPFAVAYADYTLARPGSLPGGILMAWVSSWIGLPVAFLTTVLLLLLFPTGTLPTLRTTGTSPLFPDGRIPSRYWRVVVWMAACASAMLALWAALMPGSLYNYRAIENPLGVGGAAWVIGYHDLPEGVIPNVMHVLATVGLYLAFVSGLFAVAAMVLRLGQARGAERQQLRLFVYAFTVLAVGFLGSFVGLGGWGPRALSWYVGIGAFHFFAIAAGIAIYKYRLYNITFVINRALVYGALTASIVGLYVLVVGTLSALFQQASGNLLASLLATGLIALLFHPLRNRLQRGVNRLMYGQRDEPYAVLSRLGRRLEGALVPEAALATIVETVVQALKIPYAAIELRHDSGSKKAVEHGTPAGEPVVLPLVHQGEEVGRLLVSLPASREAFAPTDRDLLEDLALQAGTAAHAARLTTDLQRSRERLVAAREEERRLLRRDLHDGVGPQLAALMLELETASDLVSADPEASALIAKLSARARETVSDVRRSVHALRPPALDELGLVGALGEVAAHYSRGGLRASVEAPEPLPPLRAAVEVACYRIAQEAMTNVVRHAQAGNCRVRIGLVEEAQALSVEVEDDGTGIRPGSRAGVGMSSMRERAEELGGSWFVGASARGGTLVRAVLPCQTSAADGEEA
jgi:signal transduction histidine kinase